VTGPAEWSPSDQERLENEMESLSLEQALIDFEVANRRVVDLTNRLVEALEENRVLKRELALMRVRRYVAVRLRNLGPVRWLARRALGTGQHEK
jgi:ribosomal 50S subunit-associated protein YjgA (DUF615 family)